MLTRNIAKILEEYRHSERRLASLVVEVLEELLRNKITKREATEAFLYVNPTPKPIWLEEALATLVDEEPEHGAPTTRELETILEKLKQKIYGTSPKTSPCTGGLSYGCLP